MPPKAQPAAKSITSYFAKTPSRVVASTARNAPSSSSSAHGPDVDASQSEDKSVSIARASSPLTDAKSSPIAGSSSGSKRSFLSDAARQAIRDGLNSAPAAESEPEPKRMKLDPKVVPTKTADLFTKTATIKSIKKLDIAKSTSRDELRKALSEDAHIQDLLKMELDTMGEDWLLALQEEFTKPYFISLKEFVTGEQAKKKIFPPANDVYSWSTLCPLKDIKVVIIGQDPYHDDGQAHGLAFSVRKGVRIPPSLRNIYKQMSEEISGFVSPKHGDLTEWAKHGVLLLNTALTVRAHEAGSHSKKGWETFTAAVLKVVTARKSPDGTGAGANGVVFMAWGAHALKMCAGVDSKKHLILNSAHPSPLSASRGFFGNQHFTKANEWLKERYGSEGGIDWASLGAGTTEGK